MGINEARKILELTDTATLEDVRRAFRIMAKRYHPDRYQTFSQQAWATRHFIKVKEAYDLLMSSTNLYYRNAEEDFEKFNMEENFDKEKQSVPPVGGDLFKWIFDKFPVLMIVLFPYLFLLLVLQEILEDFKIKAIPDSRSKKERFAFLIMSTLAAFIYLPIFYWMAFTKSGEISPTTLRIVFGTVCSATVVLFVLSEWISFFLTDIWRRSIQNDLNIFHP